MMVLTHAFMSVSFAVLTLPSVSRFVPPPVLLATAFLGGIFPDLDLFIDHRKALHYPVWLPVSAFFTGCLFLVFRSPTLLVLGFFLGSAALHSASDILAGSVEFTPWDPASEKAVYNHFTGEWHAPRRWIRYSGAPEDFTLAAAFAVPAVLSPATSELFDLVLLVLLALSAGYALVRKRLHVIGNQLRTLVPCWVQRRFPRIRFEE